MKKIILATAMMFAANVAAASEVKIWKPSSLNSYVIGAAPHAIDHIDLKVSDVNCDKLLPLKGWVKFTHPNANYKNVFGGGSTWVKEDKLIDCEINQLIWIYRKAEVDDYVNRLTKHQESAKQQTRETFVKDLDKL